MKKMDILFMQQEEPSTAKINVDYLDDIGVDRFKGLLSDDEYTVLRKYLLKPLKDISIINERQQVFKDFLANPGFAEKLRDCCLIASENKMPVYRKGYTTIPIAQRLIDYLNVLQKSFKVIEELLEIVSNSNNDFNSRFINDLKMQLNKKDEFERIKEEVVDIVKYISCDGVELGIEYGVTFKYKSARIISYGNMNILPNKPVFFSRKKALPNTYEIDSQTHLQIGYIYEAAAYSVCSIMSHLNSHIVTTCQVLAQQLLMYISGLKIISRLRTVCTDMVFPEFEVVSEQTLVFQDLYDMGLIVEGAQVVPNDFHSSTSSLNIISGVNQGGKTTFIKSIGFAQLFAQCGFPVIARKYVCSIFNGLFTHFPKEEDERMELGKFAEELARFRNNINIFACRSLVLMNESFAATSDIESADIAFDILRALADTAPMLFYVTHNDVLLKGLDKLQDSFGSATELRSLITLSEESQIERVYKIVTGVPQIDINTRNFLNHVVMTLSRDNEC